MEGWTETMGTQRCASASGRVTRAAPEAGALMCRAQGQVFSAGPCTGVWSLPHKVSK